MRVRLSANQSLVKYGNPYGDYYNELLRMMNATWVLHQKLMQLNPNDPDLHTIQENMRQTYNFMESIREARPWQYTKTLGFSAVDKSASDWEGFKDIR